MYATVWRFDPHTGEQLPEPRVVSVGPDRMPAIGTPDPNGPWWEPMIAASHLELQHGDGRDFYLITDAGRAYLDEHGRH